MNTINQDYVVSVRSLSKTFYTGFFGPIPILKKYALGKLHRVVKAVDQLSFDIEKGEIFALLGANGAGKSTTMKMLMGLIKSTEGQAFLFGHEVSQARSRMKVGYLPENPSFYEELTPIELLRLFCALNGVPLHEEKKHSEYLIDRVGMSYAADRPLRKLSKGMHQRIGIAQALIGQPDLIVLDEPFSGLDPIGRREIREVLLAERARGATLLFTSHILPDVEALCDRFVILDQGKLRHKGRLADLSRRQTNMEITITNVSSTLLKALEAIEGCQRQFASDQRDLTFFTFTLPQQRCNLFLTQALAENANVYSVQRVKPDLEALFENQDGLVTPNKEEVGEPSLNLVSSSPVDHESSKVEAEQ